MTELRPCSSCQRHFFVSADVCPFCDAAVTRPPKKRAGGALLAGALFAGATMLGTACGGQQKAEETAVTADSPDRNAEEEEEEIPDGVDDDDADQVDPDPDREEEREMPPYGAPPLRRELV